MKYPKIHKTSILFEGTENEFYKFRNKILDYAKFDEHFAMKLAKDKTIIIFTLNPHGELYFDIFKYFLLGAKHVRKV
jgi:hypothetical protein